jgi:hypothetical protein
MKISKKFLIESEIQNKYQNGLNHTQFIEFESYISKIIQSNINMNVKIDVWDEIEDYDQLKIRILISNDCSIEFDYNLDEMIAENIEINLPINPKVNSKNCKMTCKIGAMIFDNESFWFDFKNKINSFFDLESIEKNNIIDAEYQ